MGWGGYHAGRMKMKRSWWRRFCEDDGLTRRPQPGRMEIKIKRQSVPRILTQMDKTLAGRRWTASSWPPASPPSPPARRGWRPGRDWPPRRPARWCGTPAIVQLVMWSRSWLVWGQTLPGHNGPRALKSAMTHPTPLMETGIRLSMAFVPASTTLLLFNSDVNNVALVFSWRQQHGFCLLRH